MTSAGAVASEPLYFNNEGQPVYTYMVSVPHANKHLIRFPITIEPVALRRKGTHVDSSLSTPSVLLKADTGADINLMNRKTFDQLFDSKVLKPTPIRMENYGNSTVKVLGMFHAFLRWKDRVYRQLFYVTDCDRSPNFCQGMLVTLWVFSNLATQWRGHQVHNNIWCQKHHFDKRSKDVMGNCPMIPRNSLLFHRAN